MEKEISVEFSYANVLNPIDNRKETYLGCLIKSKYDEVGARDLPKDIVVILEISGSLTGSLRKSKDSCPSLAKKAISKTFIKIK
jgi:hypothetical protein